MIYPTWKLVPNWRLATPTKPRSRRQRLGLWLWEIARRWRLIDCGTVFVTFYGTPEHLAHFFQTLASRTQQGLECAMITEDMRFTVLFAKSDQEALQAMKTDQRLG